jgi:hypothetical protein
MKRFIVGLMVAAGISMLIYELPELKRLARMRTL